jgi:CBS domain-containing protein
LINAGRVQNPGEVILRDCGIAVAGNLSKISYDGKESMLRHISAGSVIMFLIINGVTLAQPVTRTDELQVTSAEEQEAREVAIRFTIRFAETKDLTPIVRDLYFSDFVERYKKFKTKDLNAHPVDLYFAPGLDYNSRLLTEGDSKDWRRFYVAANNFLLFGFISALKNYSNDAADVKATDVYPSGVIRLLNKNPNLANMIVRKGGPMAVGSVEEMRAATATLEQAVTIMRERQKGKPPVIADKEELVRVIKGDEFFKPRLEVTDESIFGFPKGTRILFMKTPLGLQLMLAKDDSQLKIFWTEIIAD